MLKRIFGRKKKRETPIDRFHREIQDWPADSAKTALLVLKATLEGDETTWNRLYGNLTLAQLEAVTRTLDEIEAESE